MLRSRLLRPIGRLLRLGLTPEKLALAAALGVVIGVSPVLGTTTATCAAAALLFRVNPAAIQVVNYLVYPLELLLLIPFLRAGARLFGVRPLPLSPGRVLALFREGVWHAMLTLGEAMAHAAVLWLLLARPATLVLYLALLPLARRALQRRARATPRAADGGGE